MAGFIKRSNQFKVRDAEYKPWNMRDVIEAFSGKSYDEVVKEQKEKRRCICGGHEGMPCKNHDRDCKCGAIRNI